MLFFICLIQLPTKTNYSVLQPRLLGQSTCQGEMDFQGFSKSLSPSAESSVTVSGDPRLPPHLDPDNYQIT